MNLRLASCATGAVLVHVMLLFGLHLDHNAVALAMSDSPTNVDVSLVDEAPAEPEATPEPPPEPPPVEPPPEPPPPPDQTPPPPPPAEMTEPSETPVEPRPAVPVPRSVHSTQTKSERPHPRPGPPHAPASGAIAQPGATAQARYRSNPKPEYPEEAKKMRQEGSVLLSVEVSAQGRVTGVSISRSSGYSLLDEAAVSAVRRWTFVPATALGIPVPSRPSVPVRFRLPSP